MAVNTSRAHPSAQIPGGLAAVPTASPTSVTTTTTYLEQLFVSNTGAPSLNLTVQDGNNKQILASVAIPGNSTAMWNWPSLLHAPGGVKWQASGSGLLAELFGYTSAT